MSLIDDIKLHYKGDSCPPEGPDLDYDLVDNKWVERTDGVVTELVKETALDQARWGIHTQWVYKRGDEYVAVHDVRPATEMQDWGDYGDPDIFTVEPVEVKTVHYRKVEK